MTVDQLFNFIGLAANIFAIIVMFAWIFGIVKDKAVVTVTKSITIKLIIEPKNATQLDLEFAYIEINMIAGFVPHIGEKISFINNPGECDIENIPAALGDINKTIECIDRDNNQINPKVVWKEFLLNKAFVINDLHHRTDAIYLFTTQM